MSAQNHFYSNRDSDKKNTRHSDAIKALEQYKTKRIGFKKHQLNPADVDQFSLSMDGGRHICAASYEDQVENDLTSKYLADADRKMMYSFQQFSFMDNDSSLNRTVQLGTMKSNGSASSMHSNSVDSGPFGDEEYKILKKGISYLNYF